MFVIATDLDRTLFPNGSQEYDGAMTLFRKIKEELNPTLFYVTGRNAEETKAGIAEFQAPWPDYAVCEVGTKIYKHENNDLVEDTGWIEHVARHTANWNIEKFKKSLEALPDTRLQEDSKQNRFKLSYYLDNPKQNDKRSADAENIIKAITPDAVVVYSVDETHHIGLLDILPREATKLAGLEYLRKREKLPTEAVIYSGDSGNDLLPLTFGYKAILVRNAIDDVRKEALRLAKENGSHEKIYIAKGRENLNGYYVSGIIEGLIHHGFVPENMILNKEKQQEKT